jgi:hypothetical protein
MVVSTLLVLMLPTSARADCLTDGEVVLNELMPAPDGADNNAEWVELFNPGVDAVSLEGWRVERATQAGSTVDDPGVYSVVFELPDVVLEPGAWLWIGGDLAAVPVGADALQLEAAAEMGNASSNSDAVRLVDCLDGVRDVVAYGTNNDAGAFLDEELEVIITERLAPKPSSSASIARAPDGVDINNGSLDFVRTTPTPGVTNGVSGSGACTSDAVAGDVVLNELMTNPGAAVNPDGNVDSGYEWIEVYNATQDPIVLDGWYIEQAGDPGHWGSRIRYTFPADSVLDPGAYAVVAEALIELPLEVDTYRLDEGSYLSMGNSEDAVRLVGCGDVVVDEVVYGGANPDGFADAEGLPYDDGSVAPKPSDDDALARRADGLDTDNSGADFTVVGAATPGSSNVDLRCKGVADRVLINEFLANPSGADGEAMAEWVELYNAGESPVDISTWRVARASKVNDAGDLTMSYLGSVPVGTVLEPGGFFVMGALLVLDADMFVESFDLYSGSDGDAVVLEDCEGTRADTVVYGGDNYDGLPEDDGLVPDFGVAKPSDDQCVARKIDGADSDASLDDFVTTSYCSLGVTNERESTPPGTGEDDIVRGCGGAGPRQVAPKDSDLEQGCSMLPTGRVGSLMLLIVVAAGRRRR